MIKQGVGQMVGRWVWNPEVVGSSPATLKV